MLACIGGYPSIRTICCTAISNHRRNLCQIIFQHILVKIISIAYRNGPISFVIIIKTCTCTICISIHVTIAILTINITQGDIQRCSVNRIIYGLHIVAEVVRVECTIRTAGLDLFRPQFILIGSGIFVPAIYINHIMINQTAGNIIMRRKTILCGKSASGNIKGLFFSVVYQILVILRLNIINCSQEYFQERIIIPILTPRHCRCTRLSCFVNRGAAFAKTGCAVLIHMIRLCFVADKFIRIDKFTRIGSVDVTDGTAVRTGDSTDNSIFSLSAYACRIVRIGNSAAGFIGADDAAYIGAAGDGLILTVSSHDRVEYLIQCTGIGTGDAAYILAVCSVNGAGVVPGCNRTGLSSILIIAVKTYQAADIGAVYTIRLDFSISNLAVLIRIIPHSDSNGSVVVNLIFVITVFFIPSAGDGAVVLTDEAAYVIQAGDLAVDAVDQGRSGNISRIFPDETAYGAAAVNRTVIGQSGIGNRSAVRTKEAAGDAVFLTAADNHAGIDQIRVMDGTGIFIENPRSAAVLCLYLAAVGNDQPITRRII